MTCSALTRRGFPCRNDPQPGTDRCRLHASSAADLSQRAAALLVALRAGVDLDVAALAQGLDIEELGDELVAQLEAAGAEAEAELVQRINRHAIEDWRAAAWLLERQHPERWAKPGARVEEPPPLEADGLDELASRRAARRGSA